MSELPSIPEFDPAAPERRGHSRAREAGLRLISGVIERLAQTLDFDRALEHLIAGALQLLDVDRGSILMLDRDSEVLTVRTAIGLDPELRDEVRIPLGHGIAGSVAASGKPIMVRDVRELAVWQRAAAPRQLETYNDFSALCVPLSIHGRVLGVMTFNHKHSGLPFEDVDLDLAQMIANQAAIALYTARLHHEVVEKRTMEHELGVARSIQQRFLPRLPPTTRGFRFAAECRMCRAVGGDYFDFIPLDENRIAVAVGDVSGHGLAAALLMAEAQSALRSALIADEDLDECLFRFNNILFQHSGRAMFMTLFLGVFDATDRSLTFASAGHHPPLVVRRGSIVEIPIENVNLPLGLRPHQLYHAESRLYFELGDLCVLYTDGLWEAEDRDGERFGDRAMRAALEASYALPEKEVVASLWRRAEAHRAAPEAEDDYTLVVARVC